MKSISFNDNTIHGLMYRVQLTRYDKPNKVKTYDKFMYTPPRHEREKKTKLLQSIRFLHREPHVNIVDFYKCFSFFSPFAAEQEVKEEWTTKKTRSIDSI